MFCAAATSSICNQWCFHSSSEPRTWGCWPTAFVYVECSCTLCIIYPTWIRNSPPLSLLWLNVQHIQYCTVHERDVRLRLPLKSLEMLKRLCEWESWGVDWWAEWTSWNATLTLYSYPERPGGQLNHSILITFSAEGWMSGQGQTWQWSVVYSMKFKPSPHKPHFLLEFQLLFYPFYCHLNVTSGPSSYHM